MTAESTLTGWCGKWLNQPVHQYYQRALFLSTMNAITGEQYRAGAWSRILVGAVFLAVSMTARAQVYLVTDLGTNVMPYGINDNGDVVGGAVVTNVSHAFFFTNGVATICKSNLSTANSINNLGQSVGYYQDLSARVHSWISSDSATLGDLGVGLGDAFPI